MVSEVFELCIEDEWEFIITLPNNYKDYADRIVCGLNSANEIFTDRSEIGD